jgi:hypothetical protein
MFNIIKKFFSKSYQQDKKLEDLDIEKSEKKIDIDAPKVKDLKPQSFVIFDTKKRIFVTKQKKSTVALFCPDTQKILLKKPSGEQITTPALLAQEGEPVIPVSGYWTKKGESGIGFYFPKSALFQLNNDVYQKDYDFLFPFGPTESTWQPIIGDWDADGVVTIGLYEKETSAFRLHNQHQGSMKSDIEFFFGPRDLGWIPLAGDWNGNEQATVGLYDPEKGVAMLQNHHKGNPQPDLMFIIENAKPHWLPIAGDWGDNGYDTLAFWDTESKQFHLKHTNSNGPVDETIQMTCEHDNAIPIALFHFGD